MKVLLDECMPRRLGQLLAGHEVRIASQMGWAGLNNGRLLALAQNDFAVFITVDRNLTHQQTPSKFRIAIIVLHARTDRFKDLEPLVPDILLALRVIKSGELTHIGI